MLNINAVSTGLKLLIVAIIVIRRDTQHRLNSSRLRFQSEYDFIIVGSGSSGAIVAKRLAEDRRTTVLLLEAGGHNGIPNDVPGMYTTLFNTEYDWNYTMEEQFVGRVHEHGRIIENRGFVLGGSSSTNAMIYVRGNPRDFDRWAHEFGAQGWSYRDVLPYFLKFENNADPRLVDNGFHSTTGPVEVTSWTEPDPIIQLHQKALNQLGIENTDINGPIQAGTTIAQANIDRRGVRTSTANAYLDPNPFPHNLHILTRAMVTRVLFNEHKTAVGVQFVRGGQMYRVMASKEVVISAGAINSPQLLMLSGIGPKDHLAHFGIPVLSDLPVGHHMTNHPAMNVNHLIKDEYQHLVKTSRDLTIDNLHQYFVNGSGPLAIYYHSFTYLSTRSNTDTNWPNVAIEAIIQRFPQTLDGFRAYRIGVLRQQWEQYYRPFYGKHYIYSQPILERVRSFGYLRLQSNNPFVHPVFSPEFLTHPQDLQDFVDATKFFFYFYERSHISSYLVPHRPIPGCELCADKRYVYECDHYIKCLIIQMVYTGYHPVGTCRMGDPRRKDTVLDPMLRVKGVERLRVCDASIMPIVTNGNTNAPSMMIGEKCADLVKKDHKLFI